MKKLLLGLVMGAALFVMPMATIHAAALVPCGGASERPCQSCDVVQLMNNVIGWIVIIMGTIGAIIIVYAGVKLLTSGGNRHAMEEAKSMINNIVIGYIIVLSAWLFIDYALKALLDVGTFGVWNQVQCTQQPLATETKPTQLTYDKMQRAIIDTVGISNGGFTETACSAGPSGGNTQCATQVSSCKSGGGQPITDTTTDKNNFTVRCVFNTNGGTPCDVGPSGGHVLCANQIASCKSRGGIPSTDSSNSNNFVVSCSLSNGGGGGGGSCSVVTDPNNACYPSKLGCFGDTQAASKICNLESSGGQTSVLSGTDLCRTGESFSGGLWQINILANYSMIPGCNGSFFTKNGPSAQGTCLLPKTNAHGTNYCAMWDCSITNKSMYNYCIAQTKNPAVNTNIACRLHAASGWRPWSTSAKACGVQ